MLATDVIVTQLFSIVLQIVWVTTNRCLISDMSIKRNVGISFFFNISPFIAPPVLLQTIKYN